MQLSVPENAIAYQKDTTVLQIAQVAILLYCRLLELTVPALSQLPPLLRSAKLGEGHLL